MGITASVLCVLGMFSFMIGMVLRIAKQNAVIAVHDPRLQESIAFENI